MSKSEEGGEGEPTLGANEGDEKSITGRESSTYGSPTRVLRRDTEGRMCPYRLCAVKPRVLQATQTHRTTPKIGYGLEVKRKDKSRGVTLKPVERNVKTWSDKRVVFYLLNLTRDSGKGRKLGVLPVPPYSSLSLSVVVDQRSVLRLDGSTEDRGYSHDRPPSVHPPKKG